MAGAVNHVAADLDRRIDQLTRLRDDLTGCIGCGSLSLGACAPSPDRMKNDRSRIGDDQRPCS
jgi:MerR family transcriptional regulator, redox-sensitive transcriptional activator SoxR